MSKQQSAKGRGWEEERGEPEASGAPVRTASGVRPDARELTKEAYDTHAGVVWAILHDNRVSDEEAIHQDVFLDYFLYVLDHDPPGNIPAFLRKIAVCKIIKARHRRSREPFAEDVGVGEEPGPDSQHSPEHLVDEVRRARQVDQAYAAMPSRHAHWIGEIYLDEKDIDEVVEELCVPEPTIRSRLRRARNSFAKYLKSFQTKRRG